MVEKADIEESARILSKADKILAGVDDAFIQQYHPSRSLPRFRVDEITLGKVLGTGGFGIVYEISKFTIDRNSSVDRPDLGLPEDYTDIQYSLPIATTNSDKLQSISLSSKTNYDMDDTTSRPPQEGRVRKKSASSYHSINKNMLARKEQVRIRAHSSIESMNTHVHYDVNIAKELMERCCTCTLSEDVSSRYALKRLQKGLTAVERARGMIDLAVEAKYLSIIWHPSISTFIQTNMCMLDFLTMSNHFSLSFS
jgi:hypothetical protein